MRLVQTARNFIKAGASFEMVLKATDLHEEKVKKLFEEVKENTK